MITMMPPGTLMSVSNSTPAPLYGHSVGKDNPRFGNNLYIPKTTVMIVLWSDTTTFEYLVMTCGPVSHVGYISRLYVRPV